VFYLNGCIHVLKYVVRCMLNYGPVAPWFILYVWGILNFIFSRKVCYNWYQSFWFNTRLVWAKDQPEFGKFIVTDFGSMTNLGKIVKPE
jgi:hypothetical protein